ncbi:MAG: ABC transporter permease [Prolixibacteraceae bacterium]|nr:ABC transporter permease [Prolixibacteraceae bacterium]
MIKIFLYQSFRNLKKNKVFAFINITGFALGIASVIVIGTWIHFQLSFDKFHSNYRNLARLTMHDYRGNKEEKIIYVPTAFGPGIKEAFPEIEEFARFAEFPQAVFKSGGNVFTESGGYYADNSVFKIFNFPLISGSPDETLTNPFEISLSREMAEKYFGDINPIGKAIDIEGNVFTVTSVFKDIPEESHLQFPFLLSMPTLQSTDQRFLNWDSMRLHTYLLFNIGTNIPDLEGKINTLISQNTKVYDELGIVTKLQLFSEIYLDNSFQQGTRIKSGDKRNIYIFTVVGIAILILSCFNYVNLFLTQKQDNDKGIAINKIVGATWHNIKSKFLIEMLIQVMLSVVIAGFILIIFSSLITKYVDPDFSLVLKRFSTLGISLLTVFFICLAAGIILSVIITGYSSRFNFLERMGKTGQKAGIVNKLVAFQYFVSIVLLISTIVVIKQKAFLFNKNLGFDKEQVIYIPMNKDLIPKYSVFKDEILKYPEVKNVTSRVGNIDEWWDGGNYWTTGQTFNEGVGAERIRVEYDYFQTLNMKLAQGRFFSKEEKTDLYNSCILNKKAVEEIGMKDPLGKEIFFNDEKRIVVGVLDNVLTKSLHEEVYPEIYLLKQEERWYGTIILVKISGDVKSTLEKIAQTIKKYDSENPFNYRFLDDSYAALYAKEKKLASLFKLFTFIAMALSCLGILGLTYYSTRRRTKEIGVRKVNGARVSEILSILNKDYVKWVVIAFVTATPVAWFAMNKWLENFAYKTTLSWWIFALAGILALGIALLTVSFQSWKAATKNPVESLRYE